MASGELRRRSSDRESSSLTKKNLELLQNALEPKDSNENEPNTQDSRHGPLKRRFLKRLYKLKCKFIPKAEPCSSSETRCMSPAPSSRTCTDDLPSPATGTHTSSVRSSVSTSSTETASNIAGAGRTIGLFYSRGGRALERWMADIAHGCGFGPHSAYLKIMTIVENASQCLSVDDYIYAGDIGWGMSRKNRYSTLLGETWNVLVRYTWKGTLRTRTTALDRMIRLYLGWSAIPYVQDYQPFGAQFASCVYAGVPAASLIIRARNGSHASIDDGTDDEDLAVLAETVQIAFGPKRSRLINCLNAIRDRCDPELSEFGTLVEMRFDRRSAGKLLRPLLRTIARLSRNESTREEFWTHCREWILEQQLIRTTDEYVTPRDLLDDVFNDFRLRKRAKR